MRKRRDWHGLAVQVQDQRLVGFQFDPRQARAGGHAVQRGVLASFTSVPTVAATSPDSSGDDGQVEQTVVDQRIRAQCLPTARLPPVADAQRDEIALPLELRTAHARRDRLDASHAWRRR